MRSIRVVIADDEPMIRRGMARLIQECGDDWKVLGKFANGCDALEYMKTPGNQVDLLVTDVKMPMMDGLALIREARRHQDFLPLVISGYDDFEYVRSALKEGAIDYVLKPVNRPLFRMQMKEIEQKIRRRKRQKELALLRQWMNDDESGTTDADWRAVFPEGAYRLLGVSLDEPPHKMRSYSKRDWELVAYAIENMLEEIVTVQPRQSGLGWTWQGNRRLFWILLYEPTDAEQLAESVRSAVLRYTGLTVFISVSGEFSDLHGLPDIRDEVVSLLYLRLIYGGNRVIAADSTVSLSEPTLPVKLLHIGQRFRLSIGRESGDETGRLLDDYLREIESLSSPNAIRQAVQYLILLIFGAWLENGQEEGKRRMLSELAPVHDHTASFHRLRKQLHDMTRLASASLREKRRDSDRTPVEQAKRWIREHLEEPLTIQAIAGQIPMNPTYFCELFKMHTGETVLDHVKRLRMEEAARLLLETDGKLHEIADRIGYKDVKYFSSQFKKHFGVLPSKYKDIAKPPAD